MRTGRKLTRRERLLKIRARSTPKERPGVVSDATSEISSSIESTSRQEKTIPGSPKSVSSETARDAIISRHILNRAARVEALFQAERSPNVTPEPSRTYRTPPRPSHRFANHNCEEVSSSLSGSYSNASSPKRVDEHMTNKIKSEKDEDKGAPLIFDSFALESDKRSEPTGGSRVLPRVSPTHRAFEADLAGGLVSQEPLSTEPREGRKELAEQYNRFRMPYDDAQLDCLDEEREEKAQRGSTVTPRAVSTSGASPSPGRKKGHLHEQHAIVAKLGPYASIDSAAAVKQHHTDKEALSKPVSSRTPTNSPARYSPGRKPIRLQERRLNFRKPGLIASIDSTPPSKQSRFESKQSPSRTATPQALPDITSKESPGRKQTSFSEESDSQPWPSIRPGLDSTCESLKSPSRPKQSSVTDTDRKKDTGDSGSTSSCSSISFPSLDDEMMATLSERNTCVVMAPGVNSPRSEPNSLDKVILIHDSSDRDWILGYDDRAIHIMVEEGDHTVSNSDQDGFSKNAIGDLAPQPLSTIPPDIVASDDGIEVTFEDPVKADEVAGSCTDSTEEDSEECSGYLSGEDGDWLDDLDDSELQKLGVETHIGIVKSLSHEISELSADFDSFTLDFSDVEMREERNPIFCGCEC